MTGKHKTSKIIKRLNSKLSDGRLCLSLIDQIPLNVTSML